MRDVARSPWNVAVDHALAVAAERRLSASAMRLYLAILRQTLGWNRRHATVGRKLLRDLSGLDGRTFERARTELVAARLIDLHHGENHGPHTRSTYELLVPATPVVHVGGQLVPQGDFPMAADDDVPF